MKDKQSKKEFGKQMKEKKDALYKKANEQMECLIRDPNMYISFLKLMANVNYSVMNSLLVFAQNQNATLLRSKEAWEEKEITVRTGEKGIEILSPGKEYIRKDGSKGFYFDLKYVYDISQTDKELPKEYRTRHDMIREALCREYKVEIIDSNVAGAEYHPDSNEMLVSKNLNEDDSLNLLFKEFARLQMGKEYMNKAEENFYSDCVGYMLACRYHTDGYNTYLITRVMNSIFYDKDNVQIRKEMNMMYQVYKRMKDEINTQISIQYQEKNG